MSNIISFRRVSAKERLRDQLDVACSILRNAANSPVDEDLLKLIGDVADDVKKAVRNFREW